MATITSREQAALPAAVADQPLGHDGALLGQVVAQVGVDGVTPVDVAEPRPATALAARQCTVHGLLGARRQPLLDLVDDLGDHLAGGRAGRVGQQLVELDEQGDQVQIGFDGAQHLWLQQQLAQVEPVDGVALQHLHHRRRKVAADVAEPTGDRRRRRPETTGPAAATTFARPGVVDRGQRRVDPRVVAVELHAGHAGARGTVGAFVGAAEHHPPAAHPLGIADPPHGGRGRAPAHHLTHHLAHWGTPNS